MDVDQYFRGRTDLIARVLLDAPAEKPFAPDWRFYAGGLGCIAAATVLTLWASLALIDPGYFARTSMFLALVLIAGTWLVTAPLLADFLLARVAVRSRDAIKGKTLGQLLEIDGALARKLVGAGD